MKKIVTNCINWFKGLKNSTQFLILESIHNFLRFAAIMIVAFIDWRIAIALVLVMISMYISTIKYYARMRAKRDAEKIRSKLSGIGIIMHSGHKPFPLSPEDEDISPQNPPSTDDNNDFFKFK